MPPQGAAYHIDWIFSNNSSVHAANHRDWFITFTEFKTHISPLVFKGPTTEVLGIGDVELDVKTHENRKGRRSHRKIILKNVLYVPKLITNILGGPIFMEYDYDMHRLKDRKTGGTAALFDSPGGICLRKLWLVGLRKGETSLNPKQGYCIHAMWSDTERQKWELHKRSLASMATKTTKTLAESSIPPYSTAEKAWLKLAYGGEYKFLRCYNLSIYKEDHRAEGRSIARALMESDAEDSDHGEVTGENEDRDEENEENNFMADLERDSTAHFADHIFSEEELDWIETNFGDSGSFLLSNGLKFYDEEDCKEGVTIVKALMARKKAKPSRRMGPRFYVN